MNTTEQTDIIDTLNARITSELTTINREEAFRDMLDSDGEVKVAGLSFYPSRIIEELDPIAFRCGVNDYADSEPWVEVNGETYDQDECEKIKEEMVSDIESEIEEKEGEIEEATEHNDEDAEVMNGLREDLSDLQAQLATLQAHSF